MNLAKDWDELRNRVKWMNIAFGLGRMVAEWESLDGVRHKVTAMTSLELLGKVRTEIDESEPESVKPEPLKWAETKYPSLQFDSAQPETRHPKDIVDEYIATYNRQLRENEERVKAQQKPKQPKKTENSYRRKFV